MKTDTIRKTCRTGRTILLALAMLLLAGQAHAQVSLRFEPVSPTVGMAETTRVSVWLDEAIDIRTIDLTMAYDAALLNSVDVSKGALFDGLEVFDGYQPDYAAGQWKGFTVVMGAGFSATGPGELMSWEVEGITPGTADISLVSLTLADAGGDLIEATFPDTSIEVLAPIGTPSLEAEPDFTPGIENSVSWNDVGADEYQIQAATDAGFSSIVSDTGWITGTSHTFTGLTHGQIYYYRVQARVATPAYETGWDTAVVFSTQDDLAPVSAADPLGDYQTSLTFDVPWTGSDPVSGLDTVELYVDSGSGFALDQTNTDPGAGTPFSFTAPDEGTYSFYTLAYDDVGNAEVAPVAADASTTVDVTAPIGDLLINGGATLTNNAAVTLTNTVTGATEMRYMNAGGAWSTWESYADTRSWTLTGPEGLNTVTAEFQDAAGNVHAPTASIEYDITPPTASFVINGDDALTNSATVELTSTSTDAATMQFSNDGVTYSTETGYTETFSWDLAGTEGLNTVYARYYDEAGNLTEAQQSITLDTIPPTASFVINGGATLTSNATVELTSASADAAQMQFSTDGSTWSTLVDFANTYPWDLAGVEGVNTVYAQFWDAAGNMTPVQQTITLDTVAPTASFVINGGNDYTGSTTVTLTSTSADAATMQFSNDGSTYLPAVPYAETYSWDLSGVEGLNTVYGRYFDLAGNPVEATETITYDITPPEASFVINGGAELTNSATVELTSTATDAVTMQFSNDDATYSLTTPYAETFEWVLGGAEGLNTVYARYYDAAGNMTQTQQNITLDTIPPTASFVINGGATLTNSATVELTSTSADAAQMQFSNDGSTWSTLVDFANTYPWDLAGVEGVNTVYAQFWDAAGNMTPVQQDITLDTVAPTASFVINGGNDYTGSTTVTLTSTSADAATMQFSNDGTTYSGTVPYEETYTWNLSGTEGLNTVYGRYFDAAGNPVDATDTITYDITPPMASFIINDGADLTNNPTVVLTSTATDAVQMQFSNDGSTFTTLEPYAATRSWDLAGNEGVNSVYAQYFDAAGNMTPAQQTITLDTEAPTATFVINGGAALTNNATVELTSTSTDAAQMQFSNDGSTWSTLVAFASTYPWDLAGTEGVNTVYAQYFDAAGNMTSDQQTITLDTVVPTASFTINDGDLITNSTAASLNLTVTGATQMRFSNDGTSFSEWTNLVTPVDWTLAGPDGTVTVYGEFRDDAFNVTPATDTIMLDTTAPTGSFVVNNDDPVTADPAVTLTLDVTGANTMEFSNNGTLWSDPEAYAPTASWTLDGGDGPKTVHARFTDQAGNQLVVSDDIALDSTAPVGSFVINNDATYTTDPAVTLNMSVTGATQMRFSADGSAWTDWEDYAATAPWTLTGPDATFTVYGEFRDAAANTIAGSDAIILDTTFPVAALVINGNEALTSNPEVVLTSTVTGATQMRFSNNGGGWSEWEPVGETTSWTLAGVQGLNTVYGEYRDAAGNVTPAEDGIDLDSLAPEGTFVINGGAGVTNNTVVALAMTVTGADQMQFSNDGVSYEDPVPYAISYPWTLTSGDGPKTVHARFTDTAGNLLQLSQDITLDTTAPAVPVLLAEPAFTAGVANTLAWGDIGAASYYLEASTEATFASVAFTSDWVNATEHTFGALTDGQIYYYRLKAQDELGNETDWSGTAFSTQDNTAPVSAATALDPFQTNATITIPWTGSDATSGLASVELFVNNGSGWTSAGTTTEVDPPVAFSYSAPADGTYSFATVATDGVGLVETGALEAETTTIVDTAPPEGLFVINADEEYTTDPAVTLTISVTGAEQMQFSNDGTNWSELTPIAGTYDWTLAAGDGLKTVQGRFFDAAGLELAAADDITLDTTAPTGTLVINGDAPVTNNLEVTLTSDVLGADQMQFSNDGTTWSDLADFATSAAWTLTPGDGEKTVHGRYIDAAGLELLISDTITVDTTAPDVPALIAEPAFTVGTENTLSWGDIGAAAYYLEGATDAAFTTGVFNSDWVTGTSHTFPGLTDGQIYHYRLKARDELDNETEWSGSVFSTQDATAPVSEAGPLGPYQTNLTFTIPWTGSDATSGLSQVELFVDDGSGWTSAGVTTEVITPVAFSYSAAGDGTYSFATVATDAAGLVEAGPTAADVTTIVDTTDPAGSFVINNDEPLTASANVQLTLDVAGADQMQFSNDGTTWSVLVDYASSYDWMLDGPDGLLTVQGRFFDLAGNALTVSDDITLDTEDPAGTMVINGDAGVTSTTAVILNNSVTGADQMQFSNDGTTWSALVDYADSYDWDLVPGDGLKTVQGRFLDLAGNTLLLSDTITLDTTAPEVPVIVAEPAFTAGLSNTVSWSNTGAAGYQVQAATDAEFTSGVFSTSWINNTFYEFTGLTNGQQYFYRVQARDELGNESDWSGSTQSTQDATAPASTAGPLDPFQANLTFTVPWTGSDAVSGLASVELFVNAGSGWTSAGTTTEVDPPQPFSYTAPGEGTFSFYLVALDQAGNVEGATGSAEVSTVVDLTAPDGNLAINGGAASTGSPEVTLDSAVTDLNGVAEMRFTNTDGTWPDTWTPYAASVVWTLPSEDGVQTVYGQYRDPAGNIYPTSDDIMLDLTPPGLPVLVAEPEFTAGTTNTVSWSDVEADAYFVQVSDDEGFDNLVFTSGWVGDLSRQFTGLSDGVTYYYRVQARDDQGNATAWSAPVFSTQDAGNPASNAFQMPTYQGTADIVVQWTGSDAVSGLASVEFFVKFNTGAWMSAGVTTEVDPPQPFTYTAPEAGTYSFYTIATDVAGNVEVATGSVDGYTTVDFTAPEAVTGLTAHPGLQSIQLSWTNPEVNDLDNVEIWAALWTVIPEVSAYPEYDDVAEAPVRPASRAAAEAADEWFLVTTLDSSGETFNHTEGMNTRGIYYYEVFLKDQAGNFSAPAAEVTRATNYRLGDFNSDQTINVVDITILGVTYGLPTGVAGYNAQADIGPTDDGLGYGIPDTDNVIDFEDLAIIAMNYGEDKATVKVEGSEAPALTWYQVDETVWALGLLEPCSSLKALHLRAQVPEHVSLTLEAGSALGDLQDYFLDNIDRNGLDAGFAVLGQGVTLPVSGELLTVTTSEPVDLSAAAVDARNVDNQRLEFALSAEPIQMLPKAYSLGANYPNPFNPMTTIAFDLPEPQRVRLVIYDLKGRLIKELVSESMEAGRHSVVWNGTDRANRRVASGVYFYQIQAGPLNDTQRMLLVK